MNDLGTHILLFLFVSFVIAAMSAVFAEPDDKKALRSVPRRFVMFVFGCGVLTAIMLASEHWFAAVS